MTVVFKDHDDELGITTKVHEVGDKTVIQKTYDAQPIIEACTAERLATAGQKWGEFRKVGTVPMAELATMMRRDGTLDQERAMAWLRKNQAFVTFDKAFK